MQAWLKSYRTHSSSQFPCSLMKCGRRCRQWLWYAMPAFLFCLLVAALHHDNSTTCSSCGTTWLSLSSHNPTSAPPPELGYLEDEELKGGSQVDQSFNTSFQNSRQDSLSADGQGFISSVPQLADSPEKAGNGTQSVGKLPTPPVKLADSSEIAGNGTQLVEKLPTPPTELADLSKKAGNGTQSVGKLPTPPAAELAGSPKKAGNGTQSVGKLPTRPAEPEGHEKVRKLELDLFVAKQAIANAQANADTHLYAPLYHNLSMFIRSYELMEQMFKIYVYEDGFQPLVHVGPVMGIYASEGSFIRQLQNSKQFITRDPEKAHMFFLPYSVEKMVVNLYVPGSHSMRPLTSFITSYVNTIASNYPFWNRSHGADHFFASCHDWGPATARGHPELRLKSIKVVCNADVTEEFVVGKDVSLPETYIHPEKKGGRTPRKRPFLAFFAGQMHGRVRPVLLKYWKDKDPDMKIYETIPHAVTKKMPYIKHMRMSKFCICPRGYEVNSPRIVEAIYYDCVPVIIADNFVLPFSEVLNWDAFSITVKEEDVPQLKQILLSIPARRYRSLQATLKHVRQHFMWHYQAPSKYDIFHMILHSVWRSRLASLPPNLT